MTSPSTFFSSLQKQRIIAKITAAGAIAFTFYIILTQPQTIVLPAVKEIMIFVLGGATAFLFAKD